MFNKNASGILYISTEYIILKVRLCDIIIFFQEVRI